MNKLLIVLPFCANDGVLAERLCDLIFLMNNRVAKNHVLLVASADTHAEMSEKVRIAAEVAFEGVDLVTATAPPAVNEKNTRINQIFMFSSGHIQKNYRSPFFWLEPDACPTKPEWFDKISEAYFAQPKRYCGSFMNITGGGQFMARVSCYPADCQTDLMPFFGGVARFNMAAGSTIIPKATKTRLVQELNFTDEGCISKLNETSVLIHHDKTGIMQERIRHQLEAVT